MHLSTNTLTPKAATEQVYKILLDGSKGAKENYLRLLAFLAELMNGEKK